MLCIGTEPVALTMLIGTDCTCQAMQSNSSLKTSMLQVLLIMSHPPLVSSLVDVIINGDEVTSGDTPDDSPLPLRKVSTGTNYSKLLPVVLLYFNSYTVITFFSSNMQGYL